MYFIPRWPVSLHGFADCSVSYNKYVGSGSLSHEGIGNSTRQWHAVKIRLRGYKTFFMLNSAEHAIYPAHKCKNANNCWHFNIYKHDKYNI